MRDITDYHTSPVQAAEVAQAANAGMLVYSHIVPPLINSVIEKVFLRGVSDAYDGPIHVGRDGMLFTLPAESDEIVVGHIND
jgi:ribonuclease Z